MNRPTAGRRPTILTSMHPDIWHTDVVIAATTYLRTSTNGNPQFQVTLADGRSFPTKKDANVAYSITNYDQDATDHGVPVHLLINAKGEVVQLRPSESAGARSGPAPGRNPG